MTPMLYQACILYAIQIPPIKRAVPSGDLKNDIRRMMNIMPVRNRNYKARNKRMFCTRLNHTASIITLTLLMLMYDSGAKKSRR